MTATPVDASRLVKEAINTLLRSNPKPFFVQVGGFDGVSFDPLRQHIVENNLSGLIIEPVAEYFDKLKALYQGSSGVTPVNCAIDELNGQRTIWRFNPRAFAKGLLPPHFAGIVSFVMEDLLKETGVLAASSVNEETMAVLRSQLQAVTVQCRTMDTVLQDYAVKHVDILQIDTEGYDYVILKLFDFARYRPAIVHYETQHLNPADRDAAERLLRSHGYRLRRSTYDTLAVYGQPRRTDQFLFSELRCLAASLHTGGRPKDALMLLEHLESLQSDDAETLQQLVKVLAADGKVLEALEKLAMLKTVAADTEAMVADIRAQIPRAIQCFNEHLALGEVAEAEKYVAAVAALIPGNPAVLDSALACNLALGRKQEAMKYAAALFAIDRTNAAAQAVLLENR